MVSIEELREIQFDLELAAAGVDSDLKKSAYLAECLGDTFFESPKAPTDTREMCALMSMYDAAAIEQEMVEDYILHAKDNLRKIKGAIALLDRLVNAHAEP